MADNLTVKELEDLLKENISELKNEAEFQRGDETIEYAVDKDGTPLVKVAIGNVPVDYDLWEGLRNPAVVGLYPAGLQEIWEYYASHRKQKVDESGRSTIFQVSRSFDYAIKKYTRAIIVSVMLPFSRQIVHDYVSHVREKPKGSSYKFLSMYEHINRLFDKAVNRTAIELVTDESERAVIAMTNDTVKAISTEAIPQTRQGDSHGPGKSWNYSQKSIASLVGLGQFGVSGMIFRDELKNGIVERFAGPIRSIIIFDTQPLVKDGSNGIAYPTTEWRRFLFEMFDFTNTRKDVNQYRFCAHFPLNDRGCNKCVDCCPAGALMNSVPDGTGKYNEWVSRQDNRFWEGKLQFDYAKCTDDRSQMSLLLPEWSCGRCLTVCIDQGIRRKHAARAFYQKLAELTVKAGKVMA